MVSHWSWSDNNSPQVSRTLLSILADLNNAVVWMVSTCPVISMSSSPCTNPLLTVPRAPITIGMIVTFMFHSFFNSQARSRYLCLFSHSFNSTLWSAGTAKSTVLQVLFFLFIIRFGRLAWIWWSVCISKSRRSLCFSFSRTDFGLCIYHLFEWSNFNFLHNSQWITFSSQSCLVLYSFGANLLHSLIMWLIVSSLSPHNLHLLFCCILSVLTWIIIIIIINYWKPYERRLKSSSADQDTHMEYNQMSFLFNSFAVHILLLLVLQCLHPIVQKVINSRCGRFSRWIF